MIISLGNGSVWISPADVMKTLFEAGDAADPERTIIRELRLPRVILAALVGWGLGIAGTGFQGLFRNPLADPFVIGASSGASFGATIVIVFNLSFFNLVTPANAAFLGSILTVILAFSFAKTGKKDPPTVSLLLAGTAISSFLSAWVSFLMSWSSEDLHKIFYWIMGSFNASSWHDVRSIIPYTLIGTLGLSIAAGGLDLLSFGEESATNSGLSVKAIRILVIGSASLVTASAVALCGVIGFVGLIAPHIGRLLLGPLHRRLLPISGLLGAIILVLADILARTLLAPIEIPVGVITSMLGAPFFLYLLKRKRAGALE